MFTELIVENFKSWAGQHVVPLKPLTLFFGPNSSGKSSLLQPLLLLKQTFEAPTPTIHFNPGREDDLVSVGGVASFRSANVRDSEVAFGFGFDHPSGHGWSTPLRYELTVAGGGPATVAQSIMLRFSAVAGQPDSPLDHAGGEALEWNIERQRDEYVVIGPGAATTKTPEPRRGLPSAEALATAQNPMFGDEVLGEIVRRFGQLSYVGPVRLRPSREYAPDRLAVGSGARGEHALKAILEAGPTADALVIRLDRWLRELGLAEKLEVRDQGARYREVIVTRGGIEANLADVGFGVGQVVPVIASALALDTSGQSLIIEEPESHLHPKAQAALGDLFSEVVSRDVPGFRESEGGPPQLLVETHSEQLLRRVQRRIADEQLDPARVAIYFCSAGDDGRSRIEPLHLDEYGRINNWPQDFFGDEMGDLLALTDAVARRGGR